MRRGLLRLFALYVSLAVETVVKVQAAEIDPELKAALDRNFPTSILQPTTLGEYQKKVGALRYSERSIPGMAGEPPVRVIIVEPKEESNGRAGVLYLHGGGYIAGSADGELFMIAPLAEKLRLTFVSVDYRLAPATRYPGSLHDNYAALRWFYDNASKLGVDSKRIAVMGGSAGGGHAAQLCLLAREKREVSIAFAALLAPALDDRTGTTTDPGTAFGQLIWTRKSNHDAWRALLGVEPGGEDVPAGAVPARAKELSGLPPTFISVGGLDLFAAEDVAFAGQLMRAGVPTELHVFPGGFHGYEVLVPEARLSRQAMATLEAALARALNIQP